MKELSIEDKAKRYDEALGKARRYYDEYKTRDNILYVEDMKDMFPELKESEDERIRKSLINIFKKYQNPKFHLDTNKWEGLEIPKILAWLEKQGEQKPIWSENELKILNEIIEDYEKANKSFSGYQARIDWLKSLKDRVQPKPKQEWSEKDRRMLIGLIDELDAIMNKATPNEMSVYSKYTNWLKSLKERYTWKPSDEQIIELRRVISGCSYDIEPLVEIEEQLKKLKE